MTTTNKNTDLKNTLGDFSTSINDLKFRLSNDEEISQNHFGDYLMNEEDEEDEKYRVWLNHQENVKEGEPVA